MRKTYNEVSFNLSKNITKKYSTSFSMAMKLFPKRIRKAIYAIYGYVRLADEIVDTFHDQPQHGLLDRLETDTYEAIERKFSLHPVIQAFQVTTHQYNIESELVTSFLHSMRMDLEDRTYSKECYEEYIYGSAEVVGLMCLRVFVNGDQQEYEGLRDGARRLGSAFQKVNFLRDIGHDHKNLNRIYFPGLDLQNYSQKDIELIHTDIENDFDEAYKAIKKLPRSSRCAVYIAYKYYRKLFDKIKNNTFIANYENRIRIPNTRKMLILMSSYLRHRINHI